jgi:hypothetical protein
VGNHEPQTGARSLDRALKQTPRFTLSKE